MKQKRGIQKGIKRLAAIVLAGALAFGTIGQSGLGMKTVEAAGEIVIDETTFPDEVFRKAISQIADTNKDGKLSSTERAAVTELTLSKSVTGDIIYSVAGVQRFPNLRLLVLSDQQIDSINLKSNTKLELLSVKGNRLQSIDLSENTLLTDVRIGFNKLTALDLTYNKQIKYLHCEVNQITELRIGNPEVLEELNCRNNRLSELVVSGYAQLKLLDCRANNLKSLNLKGLPKLQEIRCDNNQISSLNVKVMGSTLKTLTCNYNQLKSLDLSGNDSLSYVSCSHNKLSSLVLGSYTRSLYCSNNNLTSLNLDNCLELMVLYCNYNNLTKLDLSRIVDLSELSCFGNNITNLDIEGKQRLWKLGADLALIHPIAGNSKIAFMGVSLPAVYENGKYTYDLSAFPYQWESVIGQSVSCFDEAGKYVDGSYIRNKKFTLSLPTGDTYFEYYDKENNKSVRIHVYFKADLNAKLPSITKQPSNSIKTSGTSSFSVQAEGDVIGYQWQEKAPNSTQWSFCTKEGSTSATLKVGCSKERDGYQYRCAVINSKGMATYTKEVKYTYGNKARIVTQPQNITAVNHDKAQFKISATGDGLTYQWYWRKNASSQWGVTGFAGSKTDTMTVDIIPERNGFEYRCVVTDKYGYKVTSDTVVLKVKTYAEITKQPASISAVAGTTAKFTVAAIGDGLTYQWYWRRDASSQWGVCGFTGSKTNTMTVDAITARNGFNYKCVVTDKYGTKAESKTAVLTVKTYANITAQPKSVLAKSGDVNFTVSAVGDGLTYQWYWRKNATSEWGVCGFTGCKTNNLTVEVISARNGYQYRCAVKDKYGHTVYSEPATLTYGSKVVITKQPVSIKAKAGTTAKFTVTATGDGLTYQWYWRKNASSQWGVCGFTGSKTNAMSVEAITARNGYQYKCVVKDKYGNTVNSSVATFTVE